MRRGHQTWVETVFSMALVAATQVIAADVPPAAGRPLQVLEGSATSKHGYVSSKACQSCHRREYSSWHRSYHRTMTQTVTADTVIADFDDVHLVADAGTFELSRDEKSFWVRPPGSKRSLQVMQSTGSHHYQLYWYSTGLGRELRMLPFAFLKDERRWVPRHSVFLEPPGAREEPLTWNVQCLPCHSTDGRPRYDESGQPSGTQVAELGIACEACHGPGEAHAAAGEPADVPMVHPRKIAAATSAQVCGQCHSINLPFKTKDWVDWLVDGPTFRPGDDLASHRSVVERGPEVESELLAGWIADNPATLDEWFWPDGMVRVTGREYNGVRASPCFEGGEFACVSCHSLHKGSRDDQLEAKMRGSTACRQCHQWGEAAIESHTHHAVASSGSDCLNCHMPNTTYGLLKATRSHTISSPSVAETLEAGRPNACNLCHLDRSLAWTGEYLAQWYEQPTVSLREERSTVPEAVLGVLAGDAGERAIYQWHMGWQPAREISGSDWLVPYLAEGLTDTYDAVRYIAARSAGVGPEYDFVGSPKDRANVRDEMVQSWTGSADFDWKLFRKIRAGRKDPPVKLGE